MRQFLLAAVLMVPVSVASADALYDKCMNAADGTNPAFAKCGGDWVTRADTKLNEVWKQLYSDREEQTKKDLLAEQRLWNAYKEESCKFLSNGDFGREGQVVHFPACRAEVIEARIKQLEHYMSPEE